ncbi:hypothetical protein OPV22_017056 [Ensete ventricosum]|uniref:Uncharacterized protein n=1 Tax=Ensete ventricosum TaxID=4639 RepID=A0AAV8PEJ2_ENSVE|nr:hypothetical protein OPV22_017056 [Ensete ventricosum]
MMAFLARFSDAAFLPRSIILLGSGGEPPKHDSIFDVDKRTLQQASCVTPVLMVLSIISIAFEVQQKMVDIHSLVQSRIGLNWFEDSVHSVRAIMQSLCYKVHGKDNHSVLKKLYAAASSLHSTALLYSWIGLMALIYGDAHKLALMVVKHKYAQYLSKKLSCSETVSLGNFRFANEHAYTVMHLESKAAEER